MILEAHMKTSHESDKSTVSIALSEPSSAPLSRYFYVNPRNNRLHVLMPVVAGVTIGADNTCKSALALQEFFGKNKDKSSGNQGVLQGLRDYASALNADLNLLAENSQYAELIQQKKERLSQVEQYMHAISEMEKSDALAGLTSGLPDYPAPINALLAERSNLYSMVLRPKKMDDDRWLHSVNPVFSVDRKGTQNLYDALDGAYGTLASLPPQPTAKTRFMDAVLSLAEVTAEPFNFKKLQDAMTAQAAKAPLKHAVDFSKVGFKIEDQRETDDRMEVTQAYLNEQMGLDETATAEDYIRPLLEYCAPSLFDEVIETPFLAIQSADDANELLVLTQFYLAQVNIHCVSEHVSTANFGKKLDESRDLSDEVAAIVISALSGGVSVETALFNFINEHQAIFELNRLLTQDDQIAIDRVFAAQYSVIKKSPELDEFTVLNIDKPGRFVTHQGCICTDITEVIHAGFPELNNAYFGEIRDDFETINGVVDAQNNAVRATVDIRLESIQDWSALVSVLKALPTPEAQVALLDALGDKLRGLIGNGYQLANVLEKLPTLEEQAGLLTRLGEKVRDLIGSGHQLTLVLNQLTTPEAKAVLLATLGDKVRDLITNGAQFVYLLNKTLPTPEVRAVLLATLGGKVGDLIENGPQLVDVLRALPTPEAKGALITVLGDKVRDLIESGYQLAYVLRALPKPEAKGALITVLGDKVINIIGDWLGLVAVLKALPTSEAQAALFTVLGNEFHDLIEDGYILALVFRGLSTEAQAQAVFLTTLNDKVREIIGDGHELIAVLDELSMPEAKAALLMALGDKVRDLIENGYQLSAVLQALPTPEAKGALITVLGDKVGDLITDGYQLGAVFQALPTPEAQGALITSLGDKIHALIPTVNDIVEGLNGASFEGAKIGLIELAKVHKVYPKVIDDAAFDEILERIESPETKAFFASTFSPKQTLQPATTLPNKTKTYRDALLSNIVTDNENQDNQKHLTKKN
jgi:hypothetical protein